MQGVRASTDKMSRSLSFSRPCYPGFFSVCLAVLLFGAVLEFDSLEEANNYYESEGYQKALSALGDDVKEVVVRNISVFEEM